jgi:hypothetical protein
MARQYQIPGGPFVNEVGTGIEYQIPGGPFINEPTASGALTQASRFDNSSTFYAATVAAGSVGLTPTRYDNAEAFYAATVALTNITVASDITTTGWTASSGSDLYAMLDETSADDNDYITSPALGTGGPVTFTLTNTLSAGNYDIEVRADYTGVSGQIRALLLNGSDVTQGTSAWETLTGTTALYALAITTTGDASRLRFEVQA